MIPFLDAKIKEITERAIGAAEKNPKDMTEDEKFAICFVAGCAITTEPDPDKPLTFTMRTKNPVAVSRINGKLQVFERVDSFTGRGHHDRG